jgi:hypothetical protein
MQALFEHDELPAQSSDAEPRSRGRQCRPDDETEPNRSP